MSESGAVELVDFFPESGVHSTEKREFVRLVRELQVHQAEAELQTETLRRTQEDLEEARWRYFELYELAPIGYVTVDTERRVVVANLALSRLLGVDRRQLLGADLGDRMSPSDRARFERFHATALRDAPKKLSLELALRRRDGRFTPVTLEAGSSEPVDGMFRIAVIDVSNLRRAERSARDRFQAILDAVAESIVVVGSDGKIEAANVSAARLLAPTLARLVGQSIQRFIPEFSGLADGERVELRAERSDGKSFPAEIEVKALTTAGKTRLVGTIMDVSERGRVEADHGLAQFRRMAEHLDDAVFVADADTGRSLYVSPAFERIWGRPATELSEEPWPCLLWVHDEDRERVAAAATELRTGASFDVEHRVVRPDGSVRTVRCRAFSIPEERRLTGSIHDLTEERALQAELRQAQRLEAIGTLASGVAHDFNNLLMGVGGCAQLALRRLDPEHEAYGYLRRAVDAILRGANLTRQILRFSDTRRTSDEPVELDAIVGGARDLIHSLVGEQIALCVSAGAPGLAVGADPGDIEQVLLNLASNARDAMPDGGVLTFRTEPHQGGMVALSVRDTGVGMSEDTKRRVFEPFFTTKDVGKGTGLGLSTVFAVVRRMGGSIAVESSPGEGTTFTLYLPVAVPDPSIRPAVDEEAIRGQGETILIVDDDPLIRMTVETHVESLGYRAMTAATVSDALKVCAENLRPIDVVLTDIMMPGLLGSDLSRILQKTSPELTVIFMSAHPWQELARQGHLTENARLLSKPFDARDLGAALHQALKEKPPSTRPLPLRVFVVDDDPDVIDSLKDLLESEGHQVAVASGASDALAKIPEFVPDIVLCDLNVDDSLGGLDLVSKLRDDERLPKTVFLAVTGMAAHECKPAALSAGFQEVLTKPLDFQRLSRLLVSRVRE